MSDGGLSDKAIDNISLYGALGVGGGVLYLNVMSGQSITGGALLGPAIAAGAWYLGFPLVYCMVSTKSTALTCAASSLGDAAANAAEAAVNAVTSAASATANAGVAAVGTVSGGIIDILSGQAPSASASAQERYDYELKHLALKCGTQASLTLGVSEILSNDDTWCDKLRAAQNLQQTPQEMVNYCQLTKAELWDCRENNNCVNKCANVGVIPTWDPFAPGAVVPVDENGNPTVPITHTSSSGSTTTQPAVHVSTNSTVNTTFQNAVNTAVADPVARQTLTNTINSAFGWIGRLAH